MVETLRSRTALGLRQRWVSGATTVGTFCMIPSTISAGIVGRAGFDWVCVDVQHGVIGRELLVNMLAALAAAGTPALVRVARNDAMDIGEALDSGAVGVIVPMVNSARDARAAVSAARYAPQGTRSWARSTPAALGHPDYTPESANDRVLVVVQIETKEAVDNLEGILSIEGIDGAFVGPGDLAVSLSLDARADLTPGLLPTIADIAAACVKQRVAAGIACSNPESAAEWHRRGFTALSIQHDIAALTGAIVGIREAAHTALE
jgi:4-hydroxy-2-oxoheptanedioate aldolase